MSADQDALATDDLAAVQLRCATCDKEFPTGYGLKRHVESVHLKLRQQKEQCGGNVCQTCGKGFSTRFALKTHTNSVHLKIRNFPCTFCEYRGSDRTSLERHINAYHIEFGSLLCDVCGKKFYERFKLERHKKVHAAPQEICERCGMEFRLKANLKKHIEAVHLKKWRVMKCSFCDYTARKRCYLKQHLARYHKGLSEEEFACSVCGLKQESQRKLLSHFQSAHRSSGEPGVKGEATVFPAKKVSVEAKVSAKKITKKEPEVQYRCIECDRTFLRKCDLKGHLHRFHMDKHGYACKFCEHRTAKIMELHQHMAELHSEEVNYAELSGLGERVEQNDVDNEEDCEQSDSEFLIKEEGVTCEDYDQSPDKDLQDEEGFPFDDDDLLDDADDVPGIVVKEEAGFVLQLGVSVVKSELMEGELVSQESEEEEEEQQRSKEKKRATCEHCQNVFVDKYALKNHVDAVHFKLKKFSCNLCEFRTASKSTLTRHFQCVHNKTGSSHLCDICAKSFNAAHKLKRHYVIHLAPREMCQHCGRAFKIKAELKRHMDDIHLKVEKTKKCGLCDYASSRNFHLKRHMEMVHQGLKRFSCHLCGKNMSLKCNLDKHIRTVHEKKLVDCLAMRVAGTTDIN